MSGVIYRKYLNIQKFITEYRKFADVSPFLDRKTFKKTIQLDQYVLTTCKNPKTKRKTYIYLMRLDSKYIKSTPTFRSLMNSLGSNPADVIVITKDPLSIYIRKTLSEYPSLNIINYEHKHFSMEITKGPHGAKHVILSDDEARRVCNLELMKHPMALPSISMTDAVVIWLGAEIGQIIKSIANSENAGLVIRYRIVIPESGKMQMQQEKKDDDINSDDESVAEIDSEVESDEEPKENDGTDLYELEEDDKTEDEED